MAKEKKANQTIGPGNGSHEKPVNQKQARRILMYLGQNNHGALPPEAKAMAQAAVAR